MTLEDVAARLEMSHSQLSRIERGVQPWNEDLIEALSVLYKCDLVDLLTRHPAHPERLFTLVARAKPDQVRQIEAIAEALLKQSS